MRRKVRQAALGSTAMATISFARGAPSLDIVDVEGLREAAQLAFSSDPAGTTAYGTSVGYVPLREWIAEQHGVAVEQVLVTNGSMQADAFLFELLVQEGDAVIVESPTYERTRLLELAVEHDFTIFEDDPYVAIRFEGEPIPSMFSRDDAGRVVYASSFSKTVCP